MSKCPCQSWRVILDGLFHRYLDMSQDQEIKDFCQKAIDELPAHPEDKMNRWLGYVQGRLIAAGATTVDEERDYTRPLFRRTFTECQSDLMADAWSKELKANNQLRDILKQYQQSRQ